MKVQSLAVIFAIIVLPIIIILSYYIHKEVDTISTQTAYDTKLIDATHDAMAAFELNTANEDLSSVADALRSIINASTNVFFNSLATNLGMSNANKEFVQSYIPAILYTLYDGYYIYSPTRVPEVKVDEDGNVEYNYDGQMQYKTKSDGWSITLDGNTYYKQDYILKSYMPYSARYKGTSASTKYDLTINYTLDNYMTVMGYIGDVYYSKTGYLIGKNVVTSATVDGIADILSYNEMEAEEICLAGNRNLSITINPYVEDGSNRVASPITYRYDAGGMSYTEQTERLKKLYEDIENFYNEYRTTNDSAVVRREDGSTITGAERKNDLLTWIADTNMEVQNIEARLEDLTAITYYIKAQIFSNWVYGNLGNDGSSSLKIRENNISDDYVVDNNSNYTTELSDGAPAFHHDFSTSNTIIFDVNQNPENLSSNFVSHKSDVTRNSIQYNLNLALSGYDIMAGEMDIRMPVLSDSEWEKVLQNISIVSFMQGFNCGLKYYNNYAIVSSTNNELTVIPNEIYYVKKPEYNTGDLAIENPLYHRIDCPEFVVSNTDECISFKSKEVKYDKLYDKNTGKYKYDHKNFACYNCIIGSNYKKDVKDDSGNIVEGYSDDIIISALSGEKQKFYYRAVAKAREIINKTNALTNSNGYETLFTSASDTATPMPGTVSWNNISSGNGLENDSHRSVSEIKEIEVVVGNVTSIDADVSTATFTAKVNGSEVKDINGNPVELVINCQETPQTITIPVHNNDSSKLSKISLETSQEVEAYLLNVRVIYE